MSSVDILIPSGALPATLYAFVKPDPSSSSSAFMPTGHHTFQAPVPIVKIEDEGETLLLQIADQLDSAEKGLQLAQSDVKMLKPIALTMAKIGKDIAILEGQKKYAMVINQFSERYSRWLFDVERILLDELDHMQGCIMKGQCETYPLDTIEYIEAPIRVLASQENWKASGERLLKYLKDFQLAISLAHFKQSQKPEVSSQLNGHFSFKELPVDETFKAYQALLKEEEEAFLLQIARQLDEAEKSTQTAQLTVKTMKQLAVVMASIAEDIASLEGKEAYALVYTQLSERYGRWLVSIEVLLMAELNVIQGCLEGGQGQNYPLDAIECMKAPIRVLISQENWKATGERLLSQLEELHVKLSKTAVKQQMVEITPAPFVGMPIALAKQASLLPEGTLKTGYEKLDQQFMMRPINRDRHSLFRALLAHLLEKWSSFDAQAKVELFRSLDAKVANLNVASLSTSYLRFKELIKNMWNSEWSSDAIVCNLELSSVCIDFLKAYLTEHHKKYGYRAEVETVSTLFFLNICVIDVEEFGKNSEPAKAFTHHNAHKATTDLFLLYQTGHYDLAQLKHESAAIVRRSHHTADCVVYAIKKGWIRI